MFKPGFDLDCAIDLVIETSISISDVTQLSVELSSLLSARGSV